MTWYMTVILISAIAGFLIELYNRPDTFIYYGIFIIGASLAGSTLVYVYDFQLTGWNVLIMSLAVLTGDFIGQVLMLFVRLAVWFAHRPQSER